MSSDALTPGPGETALRGIIITYVAALVMVPLLVLLHFSFSDGISRFFARVSADVALASIWLTTWTALIVAVLNVFLGTATAWVLVRYRLPGRAVVSALIDLPLAIPTLVAGVMLAILYGSTSILGQTLEAWGIRIVFAPLGILLALLFVTLPFVVRAVEPVLEEVDPAEEEAARLLGASPFQTFRTVFLPAILPAAVSGGIRSLGRALGEFGSLVVISGNIPFETLTAPTFIFGEIESGAPETAAAVSTALLSLAIGLHALAQFLERRTGARHAKN
jgi:sulfate/thiosulfate transport system permease protein